MSAIVFPRLAANAHRPMGWPVGEVVLHPRLPLGNVAVLEVPSRASRQPSSVPIVIVTVEGNRYLVAMLGPHTNCVKNIEAARGDAHLRQGRRNPVHLVAVPPDNRAPILREYVRVASSGRRHVPVAVRAPLSRLQKNAERYPVHRIESAWRVFG